MGDTGKKRRHRINTVILQNRTTNTLVSQMNWDESTDMNDVNYNSKVVRRAVMFSDNKNAACDDVNDGWVGGRGAG